MSVNRCDFRMAQGRDLPAIIALLTQCGLPSGDLNAANLSGFELALGPDDRIVGIAGLDVSTDGALLRSLAVVPDWRGKAIGEALVARREAAARLAEVDTIYLLTTTAADYFRRLDYADVPRETVPPAVAAHVQFRSICPASAKCLGKRL